MKKFLVLLLAFAMLFSFAACGNINLTGSMEPTTNLSIPEDNKKFSKVFASELIDITAQMTSGSISTRFAEAGFDVMITPNYDKELSSAEHTCAFVVGRSSYNGKNVYLVSIRGTNGGEWYSNIDFSETKSAQTTSYADNFMACAEDCLSYLTPENLKYADENTAPKLEDSIIIVTGYSRGAAAANLLGGLLNAQGLTDNVYTYTFATPQTAIDPIYDANGAIVSEDNIFNLINASDLVTMLPFSQWGFRRLGTDIVMDATNDNQAAQDALIAEKDLISTLMFVASTIDAYYADNYVVQLLVGAPSVFALAQSMFGPLAAIDLDATDWTNGGFSLPTTGGESSFGDVLSLALTQHMPTTYVDLMGTYLQ